MSGNSQTPTGLVPIQGVAAHLSEKGLVGVTWLGAGLATLFVIARTVIQLSRLNGLGPEDIWIYLALSCLLTLAVLQTIQAGDLYYILEQTTGPDIVKHGTQYAAYEFGIIGLFWSTLWSIKASFLALYWRLFGYLPEYRLVWWLMATFTVLAYIGCWLASIFTCHPPSIYFQFGQCTKPIDHRGSIISISYSTAVDILTDIMIMALPLRMLSQIRINRRQKYGLGAVFCLCMFVVAAAIVRAIEVTGKAFSDPAGLAIWGVTEATIAVIVGCLPPFKRIFFPQKGSEYYGSATGNLGGQRITDKYGENSRDRRKVNSLITSRIADPVYGSGSRHDRSGEWSSQGLHMQTLTMSPEGRTQVETTGFEHAMRDDSSTSASQGIHVVKEFSVIGLRDMPT